MKKRWLDEALVTWVLTFDTQLKRRGWKAGGEHPEQEAV